MWKIRHQTRDSERKWPDFRFFHLLFQLLLLHKHFAVATNDSIRQQRLLQLVVESSCVHTGCARM